MIEEFWSTQEILDDLSDLTYRQLDHWTTSCYLSEDAKNTGNGRARRYSSKEVQVLRAMLKLVAAGIRPEVASKIARGDIPARQAFRAAAKAVGDE